jgi:hypothetical protein
MERSLELMLKKKKQMMLVPETQSGIDLSDKEGYFTNLEIY